MLTLVDINRVNRTIGLYGLSTDVKPIGVFNDGVQDYTLNNGASIFCMDTQQLFMYDPSGLTDADKWKEQ